MDCLNTNFQFSWDVLQTAHRGMFSHPYQICDSNHKKSSQLMKFIRCNASWFRKWLRAIEMILGTTTCLIQEKKITLIHSLHVEALPYGTSAQSGQGYMYNRKLKFLSSSSLANNLYQFPVKVKKSLIVINKLIPLFVNVKKLQYVHCP